MTYRATVGGERFAFGDLREQVAAKLALADTTVGEIVEEPLVDDEVTRRLLPDVDARGLAAFRSTTIGALRERFLAGDPPPREALLPDVAGAYARAGR